MADCVSPSVAVLIVSSVIYYCVILAHVERHSKAENNPLCGCSQTLGGCLLGGGARMGCGGNWDEEGGSEKSGEGTCGVSKRLVFFP